MFIWVTIEGSPVRWEPYTRLHPFLGSSLYPMTGPLGGLKRWLVLLPQFRATWKDQPFPFQCFPHVSAYHSSTFPLPSSFPSLPPNADPESLPGTSPTPNLHLTVCFLGNHIQEDPPPTLSPAWGSENATKSSLF